MAAMGRRALLVVFFALAVTACGKQRVVTQPDLPPLAPPPPPPRVVAPPDTGEQPPATAPERKPAQRAAPRNEGARETPPKAEPPKRETPAKPDTPTGREEPQPPATTLQTMPSRTQAEMERQVQSLLAQATRDLGRVNYGVLNADGKGQYDTAKRFIEQAQQAVKEQNLMLALRLADKAATIASVLVGR
jgi:outer membrane biosynthesis protein TonB